MRTDRWWWTSGHDFPSECRGATVVKPNLSELAELTGRSERTAMEVMVGGEQSADELSGISTIATRGSREDGVAQ